MRHVEKSFHGDRARSHSCSKGTLYINHHGYEERASVAPLHDDSKDIIVAEHCWARPGQPLPPDFTECCQQALHRYEDYDYDDLMNTGASPGTYRLGEVSCCPDPEGAYDVQVYCRRGNPPHPICWRLRCQRCFVLTFICMLVRAPTVCQFESCTALTHHTTTLKGRRICSALLSRECH